MNISHVRAKKKYIQKEKVIIIFLMAVLLYMGFSGLIVEAASDKMSQKHVLFINSYSYDYDSVPIVAGGVETAIRDIALINYVFMDAKYVSPELAEEQLKQQLVNLVDKTHYDLVILGDDEALDFALKYQQTYFAGIPLIFENVNSENTGKEASANPYITGIVEVLPIKQNIELAQKLQPHAKHIVVVMDNTESSRGTVDQVFASRQDFPQFSFETLNASQYTTEALKEKLGSLKDDTILFLGVFGIDGSGRYYNMAQGIRFISQAANIPVYKAEEVGIGDGLLGGYVLSYEILGKRTGELARSILLGKVTTDTLSYEISEYTYKFDYAVMKRFGIDKSQVPAESVFINDEETGINQYKALFLPIGIAFLLLLIIGLIIDRNQNRKFNARLAESRAIQRAAEISDLAKTEFLSKMSHDIRTPLNAILGITDLAKEQVYDPLLMRANIDKIDSAGHFLLLLVNDILDMSKIESGKMELFPEPYSISEFITSIKNIFEPQCEKKNIQFYITENVINKVVLVDKVRINQVFFNILSNSVKFTAPTGTISVKIVDRLYADDTMSAVDITISDTGCGMTEEFQQKMFEPFTQSRINEAITASSGSGLGLAIVKSIVDLMSGTIEVQSKPGLGTTTRIHLDMPIVQMTVPEGEKNYAYDGSLQGVHVLLVEDNPLNTEIATLLLEKEGVVVSHAVNGREAIDMLEQAPDQIYNAVLMDIRMPEMDGITATKTIRQNNSLYMQQIPIIAMTADAFDDDVKRSLAAGMNAHLTKPVEPNVLYSVLEKYTKQ